jgi:mRNA interferase MazF
VFSFGSIVLTRFPFTDLSGAKRRPALVVSRDNERRNDLIVCFITSMARTGPDMAPLGATPGTGLKVPSAVRFDKLATLDRAVIAGKIGDAPADWLDSHRTTFFSVFGFRQP